MRKLEMIVKLRVSTDEKSRWEARAQSQRMTLSDYIRASLDTVTVDRPAPQQRMTRKADPVLLSNVGRLGSNLNQIARWANTYKDAAEAAEVLLALVAVEQAIKGLTVRAKAPSKEESGNAS